MRLFLAVRLSQPVKNALIIAQNEMNAHGVRGRYTPEDNLHLTLAFIGEYPDPQPVLDALNGVSFAPFPLCLEGLGCFGDLWWAGLRRSEPLEDLARSVRRALSVGGIPYDKKRFSPHITLLRSARGAMPGIRIPEASMTADAFFLMRSDRGKAGMHYTELARFAAQAE